MNPATQSAKHAPATHKERLFWQLQFCGWGAFTVIQITLGLSYLTLADDLKNRLSMLMTGVLLSLMLRIIYRRIDLQHMRIVSAVVVMFVFCIPTGILMALIMKEIGVVLDTGSDQATNFMDWVNAVFTWSFILMGWSVFYVGINFRLEAEEERRRAIRAEGLAQQARLQALRAQLEPHFLFNTLNAISTLVIENDNPAALRMISTLGEFLRLTLDKASTPEISVAEELEFAHRYAEIQETRFGDRLSIGFNVDPAILDARVPALILQPLVENAVKHGVLSQEKPGSVTVGIRPQDGRLHITVVDDGPGFDHKAANYGVGLGNTVARLDALYGTDARFSLGSTGAGSTVAIDMPLRLAGVRA
jgi:signal transduction histidine kinase